MKYIAQLSLIILISFAGELLNALIPLPVPASIYGLAILFFCLKFKCIKMSWVKETGEFLLAAMPVMFVPSSVGFMTAFPIMKKYGIHFIIIAVITTFAVMAVTGRVVQFVIRLKKKPQ